MIRSLAKLKADIQSLRENFLGLPRAPKQIEDNAAWVIQLRMSLGHSWGEESNCLDLTHSCKALEGVQSSPVPFYLSPNLPDFS